VTQGARWSVRALRYHRRLVIGALSSSHFCSFCVLYLSSFIAFNERNLVFEYKIESGKSRRSIPTTACQARLDLTAHNLWRASMDLYKAIQDLYVEKQKLERVIASLQELQRAAGLGAPLPPSSRKRRGRESRLSKPAVGCHSA
jgi:hypothetical protein